MSDQPEKEIVTDIGAPAAKPFGGQRTGRPGLRIGDFEAMRHAAHCLADATTSRPLMGVSLQEQRALYALAAVGADVLLLAVSAVRASDNGAPPADIAAHQEALADYVRPYIAKE